MVALAAIGLCFLLVVGYVYFMPCSAAPLLCSCERHTSGGVRTTDAFMACRFCV
jgi:hypothetical protein